MRYSVHLFRPDLSRSNSHISVDLHGISRNDLSADRFRKSNGQQVFPAAVGPVKNDQWLFHLYFLDSIYTIRLNFFSSSVLVMEIMVGLPMRTVIWILQCKEFTDQFVYFLCRQAVIPLQQPYRIRMQPSHRSAPVS